MNWFNPVNWVKAGVASAARAKVDEYVNPEDAMTLLRNGVNYVADLAMKKADDASVEKVSNGLIIAGEAFIALGKGISPNGDGGKTLTIAEFNELMDKLEAAFGELAPKSKFEQLRTFLKGKINEFLGVA